MPPGKYLAGGLQSDCTANLIGVQYNFSITAGAVVTAATAGEEFFVHMFFIAALFTLVYFYSNFIIICILAVCTHGTVDAVFVAGRPPLFCCDIV